MGTYAPALVESFLFIVSTQVKVENTYLCHFPNSGLWPDEALQAQGPLAPGAGEAEEEGDPSQ